MAPPPPATQKARRPGRPRGDSGAGLREALLDAATELAVEQGFDSVGLRAIARRAGASPGMIPYYFGDREGLYEALMERAVSRMSQQVDALLEAGDPRDTDLEDLIRLYVTAMARDPWFLQLLAREVLARPTRLREAFAKRVTESMLPIMERWVERGIETGQLRDDLDTGHTAMSIAALAVFPYLFGPVVGPRAGRKLDEEFREQLIQHNERLISTGIRARSEPSP